MSNDALLEAFRISPQQDRSWSLQRGESRPVYGNRVVIRLRGPLDRAALDAGWRHLVERHEILRASLHLLPGLNQPVQVTSGSPGRWLADHDEPDLGPAARQRFLAERLDALGLEPDGDGKAASGPRLSLVRFAADDHALLLALPVFQADAIGLRNVARDLVRCYGAAVEGVALDDEPVQYTGVADWLCDLLESAETEIGKKHWARVDLSPLAELRLPREKKPGPGGAWSVDTIEGEPEPEISQRLDTLAGELHVTPNALLLAVWQAFLARSSRQTRGLVAVTFDGRTDAELEVALGPFARALPIGWGIDSGTSIATIAKSVENELGGARQWQECFTWELIDRSVEKLGLEPFFPYAFEALSLAETWDAAGVSFSIDDLYSCLDRFALRLFAIHRPAGLQLELQTDPACFAPIEAARLADRFMTFLGDALAHPETGCDRLEIVGDAEREYLLGSYNRTAADLPIDRGLHQHFEAQVARSPDSLAVEFEGVGLSYANLNQRANRLAHHLRELGVGSEELVGVCLDRSIEMTVTLLGVLKAGAAYLPLDPGYPADRLAFMLDDARPRVLLTTTSTHGSFAHKVEHVLALDRMDEDLAGRPATDPESWIGADQLAYVIYTSGSTGRPKGVMIRHRSIANRLLWMLDRFPLGATDRILFKTPFSFDASIWETFTPLFSGALLVVARPGGHQEPAYLVRTVIDREITVLQFVPSLLRAVLDEPDFSACRTMRRLFCGGEALTADLVERFYDLGLEASLHNLYGPTEVAIDATFWNCSRAGAGDVIPIGHPLANVEVHLLDAAWRLVPEGAIGELHVGGAGLARGYLHRPELTAERFIPDFCSGRPSNRLYKTGDLARHREDGSLEFMGRIDHQVKVRGFRIELGEIEARLRRHPQVFESVVMARNDGRLGDRLIGYVVPKHRAALEPGAPVYRLPNGIEITHLNKSETDWLFTEVFEESSYLLGGMTLRDGDVVFDVGANIGLFSLFVHATVDGAQVYAFEPSPPTFEKLRTNVVMHGLAVEPFDFGLSDAEKEVTFTFYPKVSASSGVYADLEADALVTRNFLANQDNRLVEHADELMAGRFESQTFIRPMRRLSDVIRERGVERIDYLKVDVEKSELDVLRGIDSEDWPKIKQVSMEVHDSEGRLEQIVALLEAYGFAVSVDQLGLLENTGLYNLYAIHPTRKEADLRPPIAAAPHRWTDEITTERLRAFLGQDLPEYMIPSVFVILDSLPLSPNGKIDRKALPEPEQTRDGLKIAYVAPRTPLEEQLSEIWLDLLGVETVGVEDNFFDLGGHSLLATRLVSRLREAFKTDVPLRNVFEAPTVAALAGRLEALWARDGRATAVESIPRASRDGRLPLSFAQERLWFLAQLAPDSAAYNVHTALRLEGELDAEVFAEAIGEVARRHEVLRTTFDAADGEPFQVIAETPHLDWTVLDLTHLPAEEQDAECARVSSAEARKPFDLRHGPLFRASLLRLGPADFVLIFTLHHTICDGWSMGRLVRELVESYRAALAGEVPELPELAIQYADYARWQRDRLQGATLAGQAAFWRDELQGAPPLLELPTDRPRPAVQTFVGCRVPVVFEPGIRAGLTELAQAEGATLFMALLAAFQILLGRISGQADVVVGTPIANRQRAELENLIGLFVNTLALRSRFADAPSFCGLLARVRERTLEAYMHQELPFEKLVEELQPQRSLGHSPLFQVLFALQNTPREEIALPGLAIRPFGGGSEAAQFDLSLYVRETEGGLVGSLEYNVDLFDAASAKRIARSFETLLQASAREPGRSTAALPLLRVGERHQILIEWGDTAVARPPATLHGLIAEQARRTPNAVAVLFEGQPLRYGELDARSNQLAHHLRDLGVGPETLVGLCAERSIETMVGLLGILKAGGAYVPLDPEYPKNRLSYMIEDSRVLVLVTLERHLAALPREHGVTTIFLDRDWGAIARRPERSVEVARLSASPAYAIYTSGSTGAPKGAVNTHHAICNRLLWMQEAFALTPDDRVVQKTPISFDVSVWELFWPLMVGSCLVMARPGGHRDGTYLASLIQETQATTIHFVPSMLQVFLSEAPLARCGSLRRIICSGEALPTDVAARCMEALPAGLFNLYGPTEAAVDVTVWDCRSQETRMSLPIGRPIANTRILVLDSELNQIPPGVVGELYIAGDGLARGYLNRPDLTADRFVPGPHGGPGERLYRTGDRVHHQPDGSLIFLGRGDHQVKLRGFRVELEEIEATLREHAGIGEAAVVLREDVAGDPRLVAYLVPAGDARPGAGELRSFLGERLPEHMVPTAFVTLDELPLSPSGKLDRRLLPAPAENRPELATGYLEPRTEAEQTAAAIWRNVLRVDRIGLDDNFFDLGGNSLLMVRVQSRLCDAFGREISLVDLFRYPTVRSLVAFLRPTTAESPSLARGTARAESRRRASGRSEDGIALIGMAGRFPGARSVEELWANLCGGVESISFFSDDELRTAGVEPGVLADPRLVKAQGVLDDIDRFDAEFFGFSPREAELMDPQHRIFFECAWEALEDAGCVPSGDGRSVGVYAGLGTNTYWFNLYSQPELMAAVGKNQVVLGNEREFLPTRLSYKLNLRGPSLNVQTACSTSLVAVHLACQSLLSGESDIALAGGATASAQQRLGYLYQEEGILSPDGHCRAFDARAQGTVGSNGAAVVVLKRLSDALADGDTIRAVIRGSAVNNDGFDKVGYTAPSIEGQAQVIAEALAVADVDPDTIGYVETHGTGTALGDPIEIAALIQVFGPRREERPPFRIGSIKTNVGHMDTAAGVAGLIKAVLSVERGVVPPSLHFETPSPLIDFASAPLEVATALEPWRGGGPRRAGVSSFGIGGTNAHVVIEEAPAVEVRATSEASQLLILSATTRSALETATDNLSRHLAARPDLALADIAHTLQVGRKAFAHRRALVCDGVDDAIAALAGRSTDHSITREAIEHAPVVFLFPGQGAQYPGMARALYDREPAFRAEVDSCAERLRAPLEVDLREVLFPPSGEEIQAGERLRQTTLAQPALFVVEYALARLWMSWGVVPEAMNGHSIGEYVAACLAGVFDLDQALDLVALRGRLMQELPEGAMLAVSLPELELSGRFGEVGESVEIAAINAPDRCVVSGPREAIEDLRRRLAEEEVAHRLLHISHAFHSSMMEPILAPFQAKVSQLGLRPPRIPFISNLTGRWISDAEAIDPRYWTRHLRKPVRFADGVRELLAGPRRIFLELGPPVLAGHLRRQPGGAQRLVVASLPRPDDPGDMGRAPLAALGQLWAAGATIDWARRAGPGRRKVSLPTYPFERKRYWVERRRPEATERPASAATKRPEIADWFYVPSWKPTAPPAAPDWEAIAQAAPWLVFISDDEIGAKLVERLTASMQPPWQVRSGPRFAMTGERTFTIDPKRAEDYGRLLRAIEESGQPSDRTLGRIVHLWSLDAARDSGRSSVERLRAAQSKGFASLLHLVRAWTRETKGRSVGLDVVTADTRAVGELRELRYEAAPALGLCKVVRQEYPEIACRNVDLTLAPGDAPAATVVGHLFAELASAPAEEAVAFRRGRRWVEVFEPLRLDPGRVGAVELRQGGCYLIVGGLGAVGLAIARHLARRTRARLVLVGRTGLPGREEWPERAGRGDGVARRIRQVQELEALGAEVLVLAADVAHEDSMRSAVTAARDRFGSLHGVIHAAGAPVGMLPIQETGAADVERHLEPKAHGLVVLDAVLADLDLDFRTTTSSLSTVLGGLGFAAYAAANAFLDAFAESSAAAGRPWTSVAWDGWKFHDAPAASGVAALAMTAEEGTEAFERILGLGAIPRVVVSTADLGARLVQWQRMPAAESEPRGAEALHDRPAIAGDYVAPRNPTEESIAALWRELLGIRDVGAFDNFFELGGDSLLATQLISRLRRTFQVEVPLRGVFEAPTVSGLAALVARDEYRQDGLKTLDDLLSEIEGMADGEVEAAIARDASSVEG